MPKNAALRGSTEDWHSCYGQSSQSLNITRQFPFKFNRPVWTSFRFRAGVGGVNKSVKIKSKYMSDTTSANSIIAPQKSMFFYIPFIQNAGSKYKLSDCLIFSSCSDSSVQSIR